MKNARFAFGFRLDSLNEEIARGFVTRYYTFAAAYAGKDRVDAYLTSEQSFADAFATYEGIHAGRVCAMSLVADILYRNTGLMFRYDEDATGGFIYLQEALPWQMPERQRNITDPNEVVKIAAPFLAELGIDDVVKYIRVEGVKVEAV